MSLQRRVKKSISKYTESINENFDRSICEMETDPNSARGMTGAGGYDLFDSLDKHRAQADGATEGNSQFLFHRSGFTQVERQLLNDAFKIGGPVNEVENQIDYEK